VPNDAELIALIPELVGSSDGAGLIIVDDFHRLADGLKHRFADLMKDMADREDTKTKLVLIGINRAGNSLVDFAPDLNNRIDTIRFEINSVEAIRELISKGERALNISISCADAVAADAGGSFHITQILCHELCLIERITESAEEYRIAAASLGGCQRSRYQRVGANVFKAGREVRPRSALRTCTFSDGSLTASKVR